MRTLGHRGRGDPGQAQRPAVPRSPSGRWPTAPRRHHGRGATVRPVHEPWPGGNPRGSSVPSLKRMRILRARPSPDRAGLQAGSRSPAGGSGDRRTRPGRCTVERPGARSTRIGTTVACRRTCKVSRRWRYAARASRRSPSRCRAGPQGRAAGGSHPAASPAHHVPAAFNEPLSPPPWRPIRRSLFSCQIIKIAWQVLVLLPGGYVPRPPR